MNSKRNILFFALFAAGALAVTATPLFTLMSWKDLSDRDLTPLGRAVLNAGGSDWVHAETRHFIFHASTTGAIEEVAAEAEFAFGRIGDILGTNSVRRKGHVFVVGRRDSWEKVLQDTSRKDDSLAMQMQNDLFILKESNSVINVLRVPHELVHFRLWQVYGNHVPIWLDEGMAGYVGWKAAVAGHAQKGKQLVRAPPRVSRKHLLDLAQLTDMTTYPPDSAASAAFYVEAELLVSAIARTIGDDTLGEFVKAVAGDRIPWNDFLRERFSFADSDFAWLQKQIEKYATE